MNIETYDLFTGLGVALIVVVIIAILLALIISIPTIIGQWKVLNKGGKPGWGALIPFYNTYLLCDMVGINPWWIVVIICASLLGEIPVIGLISPIASIYFTILLNVSLARAFGKQDSFAIGLILLPPIFYPILGFGKDNKYVGKNPMKDILFDTIKEKNESKTNNNQANENVKYCQSCGNKTTVDTKYCPKCGKEM